MLEKILVCIIVSGAAIYIGRRFLTQWQQALRKDDVTSCTTSCGCCSDDSCDEIVMSRNTIEKKHSQKISQPSH